MTDENRAGKLRASGSHAFVARWVVESGYPHPGGIPSETRSVGERGARFGWRRETQVHSQGAGFWSNAEGPVERGKDGDPCPGVFGSSGFTGGKVTARGPSRGHSLRS